jgi:hypothetical protein
MEQIKIHTELEGLADIMFDQFFDHSKEPRPAEQKFYIQGKNQLVFPSLNIMAFLFNQKGNSCATKFEGKKRNDYISMGFSHISIIPQYIPLKGKDQKPIFFKDFEDERFYIQNSAPTTKLSGGGFIKQEAKPRPVLRIPWFLEFEINLYKNPLINSQKLQNWFENGGILIGLGTYRPLFGRFIVKKWKIE